MKKKLNIAALIALGTMGTLSADDFSDKNNSASYGNMGYHLMTEEDLMLELSEDGAKLYNSLDAEGKKLALIVASQRCAQSNACANLNACADANHACMGLGTCAKKGKCAVADKNMAVKLVADKMAKKRANLTK